VNVSVSMMGKSSCVTPVVCAVMPGAIVGCGGVLFVCWERNDDRIISVSPESNDDVCREGRRVLLAESLVHDILTLL